VQLEGPWPDLVIAVGRRTVPVAQWIRRQNAGRTRLVHLGRPRAPLSWFDLIVTTPQYGLPERSNVVQNPVPLTPDPAAIPEDVLDQWRARLAHLPRPWIAVLAGGSRTPYRFDVTAARDLGLRASALSASRGGSLLVTTSPRTGDEVGNALAQAIVGPHFTYLWQAGTDNPYKAFLVLADRFIVTGESVSMVTEACRTGRPTQIFQVPRKKKRRSYGNKFDEPLRDWLTGRGVSGGERDVEKFTDSLVSQGLVGRLDDVDFEPSATLADPLSATLKRVRALFPEQVAPTEAI